MDFKYTAIIIIGLGIGALTGVVGASWYSEGIQLFRHTQATPTPQPPGLTSIPAQHPLPNDQSIDLLLLIVNASGDEAVSEYAEQDLIEAGFTIVDIELAQPQSNSSIVYKPDKETLADTLIEWTGGDWGDIQKDNTLPEESEHDAVLTIGIIE